jgi:hypothetical protein
MKETKGRPWALRWGASRFGAGGFGAISIGFLLAVPIAVCLAVGMWLDSRFGTGYWTPVLFVVGAVVGFREMLVAAAQISRMTTERQAEEAASRQDAAKREGGSGGSTAGLRNALQKKHGAAASDGEAEEIRTKPRFFTVPEPPRASFESADISAAATTANSTAAAKPDADDVVREDVLREWLPDESPQDRQQN